MKRMLFAVAYIALTLSSAGYARDAKVLERTDKFSGATLYYTPPERPTLEGGSFLSERFVLIQLNKMSSETSPGAFLHVDVSLPDWMFIESGQSFVLKVGGKLYPLTGVGSADNRTILDSGVSESADYAVPSDVLQVIESAQAADFRIVGSRADITGSFTPTMLADMRLFAQQLPSLMGQVKPASVPAPATSAPVAVVPSAPAGSPQQPFGVKFVKVPWTMRMAFHLKSDEGVWIVDVATESAAASAGLQVGDVILSFDGRPIHNVADLQAAVSRHQPGAVAAVDFLHGTERKHAQVAFSKAM